MLTIRHTAADGLVCEGTARGDGSAELLKRHGFRWWRAGGCWYVRNTRGRMPLRYKIDAAAEALRAADFEVEVVIEEATGDERAEARAATLAATAERSAEKADALSAKATREWEAAHKAVELIPPGQPILVGHHSEARHRRDIARSDSAMRRGIEASRGAEAAANRAKSATAELAGMDDLVKLGRRKDRLTAEERRIARTLAGVDAAAHPEWHERTSATLADIREELRFIAEREDELRAEGARSYGREDIAKGDLVLIRHGWCRVAKANPKTVAVEVGMPWPLKYAYHEVRGVKKQTTNEEVEAA